MPKPYRVLCMWDVAHHPDSLDPLREVAEVDVVEATDEFLLEHIHEYDVYLSALKVRFTAEVAAKAKGHTRLVYTPSTGLDHLDLEAIEAAGIEWRCIKYEIELLESVTATAEMAWTLMLSAVRKVPWAHAAAMRGYWGRDRFRGRQMARKTLGVVGVGRLGRMVVDYGRAFRMNVIGCDPNPLKPIADLEYVSFDELLERSDVISLHVHLTKETEHMINAAAFEKMKDGVVIVNTSRGMLIDEDAFLKNLESGKVGAAGLDVIVGEWREDLDQHPLIKYARDHENLVIVPHLGGTCYESQRASSDFVAQKTADLIREWGPKR